MWVRQSTSTGASAAAAAVSARSMSSGSWPSQDSTCQPAATKRARWSVVSDSDTLPSIEMPLLSHSTIRRLSFCIPARPIASWLIPSIRQPSPAMTQVRWFTKCSPKRARSDASAIAKPTPFASPCPSGPVVVSIPAAWPNSGWPAVAEPNWRKARS